MDALSRTYCRVIFNLMYFLEKGGGECRLIIAPSVGPSLQFSNLFSDRKLV